MERAVAGRAGAVVVRPGLQPLGAGAARWLERPGAGEGASGRGAGGDLAVRRPRCRRRFPA